MFEISEKLATLAAATIKNYSDVKRLDDPRCRIAFLMSEEKKTSHKKLVYADTEKVKDKFKVLMPYDFVITFYKPNVEGLDDAKMEILMYHELRHVGFDADGSCYIVPHDVEDFSEIIDKWGMNWVI